MVFYCCYYYAWKIWLSICLSPEYLDLLLLNFKCFIFVDMLHQQTCEERLEESGFSTFSHDNDLSVARQTQLVNEAHCGRHRCLSLLLVCTLTCCESTTAAHV